MIFSVLVVAKKTEKIFAQVTTVFGKVWSPTE